MGYDFEKIGRQSVLEQLTKKIKGKADYLQLMGSKANKLETLKDLEKMVKDAYKILSEL